MVVKRFISIALAGLLAIGSINTGSVRAYAADEDLLLEEASFEEGEEELLEEELTEEPADEAGAEAAFGAEGEEVADDDAEIEEDVQSDTAVLKIRYFDENGDEIGATFANPDAGIETKTITKASAQDIALKPIVAPAYHTAKWIAKGSIAPFTLTEDGTRIKAEANKVTGNMEISVQREYTPYTYTINYYTSEAKDGDNKSIKNPGVIGTDASYKKTYTYSASAPYILIPDAPAISGKKNAIWYTANIAADVATAVTPLAQFTDDPRYHKVTPENDPSQLTINLFADYSDKTASIDETDSFPDFGYWNWDGAYPLTDGTAAVASTITLTTPVRPGYTFDGWFSDEALTKALTADGSGNYTYTVDANDDGVLEFYTKWTAKTYKVVYSDNVLSTSQYKTVTKPANFTFVYDDENVTYEIELGEATRPNYTFGGWTVTEDGTTSTVNVDGNGNFLYIVDPAKAAGDDGLTFAVEPIWSLTNHRIRLVSEYGEDYKAVDANDSTDDAIESYTILDAETAVINPATIYLTEPTGADLTFDGWLAPDGTALALDNPDADYGENNLYKYDIKATDLSGLKFTAKWKDTPDTSYAHITYALDGGVNNPKNKGTYKLATDATTEINIYEPEKEGYSFDGWYADAGFVNGLEDTTNNGAPVVEKKWTYRIANLPEAIAEANQLTFYAKWEKDPVAGTVIYDSADPGTIVDTYTVDADGMPVAAIVATDITGAGGWNSILADAIDKDGKIKKDTLPQLTKPGYIFLGYYTTDDPEDQNYTTEVIEGQTILEGNQTLYAAWKPITYKVTYVSTKPAATATVTYAYGEGTAISAPFNYSDIPTATQTAGITSYDSNIVGMGSVLVDGNDSDDIIDAYEYGRSVAEVRASEEVAITLTAVWANPAVKTYYVKYNANCEYTDDADFAGSAFTVSGAASLTKIVEAEVGKEITITGREYVRKGYTLKGWMNGSTLLKAGDSLKLDKAVTGQVVELKANWVADKAYTLKVNLNGGKYTSKIKVPTTYKYNAPYTLPIASDVQRVGYKFVEWNTKADGSGDALTKVGKGSEAIETGAAAVYAVWEKTGYTITFETNGGSEITPIDVDYDETLLLSSHVTTRPGYKFKKWTAVVNGKKKEYSAKAKIKGLTKTAGANITFTASWTPIKYTITYSLGKNAKMSKPVKSYTPNKAGDIVINKPTRPGYSFVGWAVTSKNAKSAYPSISGTTWSDDWNANLLTTEIKDEKGVGTGKYSFTKEDYGNVKLIALWEVTQYTFEFYEGSVKRYEYAGITYSSKMDFTDIASNFELKDDANKSKTVKGFGFENGKLKYSLNKVYKVESIIKDLKLQNDPDAGKTPIKFYAVTEAAKLFANVTVSGVTTQSVADRAVNFDPAKGTTIKATNYAGYTIDKVTVVGGTAGTDYEIAKDNKSVKLIKGTKTDKMSINFAYKASEYTVYIMPQASDAKYGTKAISKKDGYKYEEKVPYNTEDKDFAAAFENISRDGYTLIGFSTTTKSKGIFVWAYDYEENGFAGSLAKLKANKNGVVKLYAIWSANYEYIGYDAYAKVTNAPDDPKEVSSFIPAKAKTYIVGKGITLPKLNVPGYKFVGWELVEKHDNVTVAKNGYATKITKKSSGTVYLRAVLTEKTYKLSVNPNGGKFNGKKSKQTLGTVRYSEDIQDYITKASGSAMVRAGYRVVDFTTVAKPKTTSVHYGIGESVVLNRTSAVTLYPQWLSTAAAKGVGIAAEYAVVDGVPNVIIKATGITGDTAQFEIQVSKDKNFASGVKVVKPVSKAAITAGEAVPVGTDSNIYYVRVRELLGDVAGGWFDVVTASRNMNSAANLTLTIAYMLPNADGSYGTSAGTVTVNMVPGETIGKLIVPPLAGYTTDGKVYLDSKCETEAEGTKADNLNLYVKAREVKTFKLNFDMNDANMSKITSKASVSFTKGETKYTKSAYPGPSVNEAYGFGGWYKDAALTTAVAEDSIISSAIGDVTWYAKWTPYTYTVKYDKNDEKATGTMPSGTATYGQEYTLPAATYTAPEGYVFDRWQLPDGRLAAAGAAVSGLKADKNGGEIEIKATWKKQTTANLTVVRTVQTGKTTYTPNVTTTYKNIPSGQDIKGFVDGNVTIYGDSEGFKITAIYYMTKNASGKDVQNFIYNEEDGIIDSKAVGSVDTVYVAFRPITYTVTFDQNGGLGTVPANVDDVPYALDDAKLVAPDSELTKAGYSFNGWNTRADGKGIHYAVGAYLSGLTSSDPINDGGTATLFAEWKSNTFTIVYYPNYTGGTPVTKTVNYDDAKAADPKDLGFDYSVHTFTDWTAVVEGGSVVTGINKDDVLKDNATLAPQITVSGRKVKMYAQWTPAAITNISFNLAEGSTEGMTKVVYTPTAGENLYYQIAAAADAPVVALGDPISAEAGWTSYTAGNDIAVAVDKVNMNLYLVVTDSSNKAQKYGFKAVDGCVAIGSFTVTAGQGSVSGSTTLTVSRSTSGNEVYRMYRGVLPVSFGDAISTEWPTYTVDQDITGVQAGDTITIILVNSASQSKALAVGSVTLTDADINSD